MTADSRRAKPVQGSAFTLCRFWLDRLDAAARPFVIVSMGRRPP